MNKKETISDDIQQRIREIGPVPAAFERGESVARAEASREIEQLREAVALHARTLDDVALGKPDARDRDDIDNALYNVVRRLDPAWWDARVPGLASTAREPHTNTSETT